MADKRRLDVSQIFLTFMALVGDVEKTAAALDLDPKTVRELAESEGWDAKIKRLTLISKGGTPGSWERAQNRALNYVQAQQMRRTFDTLLETLTGKNAEELLSFLSASRSEGGKTGANKTHTYSARFLSDLASALEKVQFMSYAALGDTIKERQEREDKSDEVDANTLHAAVIQALNSPQAQFVPSHLLVEETSRKVLEMSQDGTVSQPDTERKSSESGTEPAEPKTEPPKPE